MEVSVKNLAFDLASGRAIFDDDREITVEEANDALRKVCYETLGLSKDSSPRAIKRALNKESAKELFEMIEEILDKQISAGWREVEFFNEFVEDVNLADGDEQEFYVEDNALLTVEKVAGSHHDLVTQKLGLGEPFTVPTSYYAVKVGSDIRLFLTGKKDWNQFIDAVAKAFINKIMDAMFTAFMGASALIPATEMFNKSGALSAATKEDFDELIENVTAANNNVPVVIMGTKIALKKLNGLTDVDWIAASQKENFANTGIAGNYEGTTMIEIPQRFKDNSLAQKLVDSTKLFIMPLVSDNKFVKFVDYGETEFTTPDDHKTRDDMQTYEVQRRMGAAAVISRYFGTWTIES